MVDAERVIATIGQGNPSLAFWKMCKAGLEEEARSIAVLSGNVASLVAWQNPGHFGYTPLHAACQMGRYSVSRFLVEELGADVNASALAGEVPLHEACVGNHQLLALYLLEQGADLSRRTSRGQSPADVCKEKQRDFLEALRASHAGSVERRDSAVAYRRALACSIVDRSSGGVEAGRQRRKICELTNECDGLRSALRASEASGAELEEAVALLRQEVARLGAELGEARAARAESANLLHTQRRRQERLVADAHFEAAGLRRVLDSAQGQLEQASADQSKLEAYVGSAVESVARKNMSRGGIKALGSPRAVKLKTLQRRLDDAEDRAFKAFEDKEHAEAAEAAVALEMRKARTELLALKAS